MPSCTTSRSATRRSSSYECGRCVMAAPPSMRVGPLVVVIRTIAAHRRRTCSLYHSELTRAFARVDDQMKSHFAARHGRFCAGFSDAEMLGPPHARTVGVGEAPRHEVAVIGAGGCNGRYGDLIGAQVLIVGSRSPRTFTRTRYRHAGLWERGCASLRWGDLRRRSGAFGQVGSLPAQDQRIGGAKLRAGSRVCLMTCRS